MMDINIQIEYSGVTFKKLKNAKDDIVNIAEATGICIFGMMESSHPIYYNISLACNYQIRSINAAPTCQLTVIKQSLEPRAIETLVNLESFP